MVTLPADVITYSDVNLQPNSLHRYNVRAISGDGSYQQGNEYLERTFPVLADKTNCDVLVVGATTAGITAAITASRYGLKVVLIEETRRLGGMPVNGLGSTDLRRQSNSSGFFEEFRTRVQRLYGQGDGLRYEPRVAHQAIKEMLWSVPDLLVYRQVRPVKVYKKDGRILSVTAEELPAGRIVHFIPRLVVDATDCGDVAAWAGAPFRVGREARSAREPHAGEIFYDRAGDRPVKGSTGKADKRVQSYAYLMTVKDYGLNADKTIPKPDGYDPKKYEHAPAFMTSWAITSGELPGKKYEVNQHPQGSDLQGVNYNYPTANYAERRRIEKLYKDHALGYLYYIQTVEKRPNIGLSDDDYRDTDGWPSLLYIREARRFESDRMIDETDIREARSILRPDAIGIGDYPMDSHAVQPKTDWSTPDMGEGEFYLPQHTPWHQVPYSIMIPKGVSNVFTPTAVSATHVAYGTLRLEPVRMQLGAAAGIAAYLSLHYGVQPRDVPVRQIQEEISKHDIGNNGHLAMDGIGAPGPCPKPTYLYAFPDVTPQTPKYQPIMWLAARGFYPCPQPPTRTPTTVLLAQPFKPDEAITQKEAARLLELLRIRKKDTITTVKNGIIPNAPITRLTENTDIRISLNMPANNVSDAPLTRAEAAKKLVQLMGWKSTTRRAHYADIRRTNESYPYVEALHGYYIDSILWDQTKAFNKQGRLLFRPDEKITRAQFAQLIYLACIHIGPLWEDNPMDRR